MLLAIVADFHGNWQATQALEKDLLLQKPDRIIGLGDYVGKGPDSDLTYDWAKAHCDLMLGGNWDYGVSGKFFPRDAFYWDQLGDTRLNELKALPSETELILSGRRLRLFHGRPLTPGVLVPQTSSDELEPFFEDREGGRFDGIVYADVHRQALRVLNCGLLLNTGSIGNEMGQPFGSYLLLECEEGPEPAPFEARFRQFPYDRKTAVDAALAAEGLPEKEGYANELETGRYSHRQLWKTENNPMMENREKW